VHNFHVQIMTTLNLSDVTLKIGAAGGCHHSNVNNISYEVCTYVCGLSPHKIHISCCPQTKGKYRFHVTATVLCLLSFSQKHATGPYLEPDESSPHPQTILL
jgi:hypothetical protein